MYKEKNNPQDSSQRTLPPSNFKSQMNLRKPPGISYISARSKWCLGSALTRATTLDSGTSKAERSSWSPAAGSARDGHPAAGPRLPPSLLTDDGLLGGGGARSAQPGTRRPAQDQAQHTQQALQSRHRARRLPPPFKGTAGRAPRAAAAAAEAAAGWAVSRPRAGGRRGRCSAARAYGKCSSGVPDGREAGAGGSGDADALPASLFGPQSAARDPAVAASAPWPVQRTPQSSGRAWGGRKLPFQLFYGGDLSHS